MTQPPSLQPVETPTEKAGTGVTPDPTPTGPAPARPGGPPDAVPGVAALNRLRALAGVAPVRLEPAWAAGCAAHARYLVRADRAEHREDPASPHHTAAGEACAPGHYFVSSQPGQGLDRALAYWTGGAFHLPQLLDPRLRRVAVGEAQDAGGTLRSAVVLDVRRGLAAAPPPRYPVRYPGPGTLVTATPASVSEWPDPLPGCFPDRPAAVGAPIALLMGPGVTVGSVALKVDGRPVAACLLAGGSFQGASAGDTRTGRGVLAAQGAGVALPRVPLRAGARVQVSFGTSAGRVGWSFGVR